MTAEVYVQWKGTDACFDFHCPCQPESRAYEAHFDGYLAYLVQCPNCGVVYAMPVDLKLEPITDSYPYPTTPVIPTEESDE